MSHGAIRIIAATVGHIGCLRNVVVDFFDAGKADVARAEACAAGVPVPPFSLT